MRKLRKFLTAARKKFIPWLVVPIVLVVLLAPLEHWSLDHTLARQFTFDLIQRFLVSGRLPARLPVVVLDIEDVRPDTNNATDRVVLAKLMTELASADVKGIGIDVDFSPDDNGFISRNDPGFFCFCRDLRDSTGAHVPVRLGVHRRAAGASFQWLGGENFKDLAASIVMPKNPRVQPAEITSAETLPSLSFALDDAVGHEDGATRSRALAWVTSPFATQWLTRQVASAGAVVEFAVDYSAVDLLEEGRLFVKNTADYPNTLFTCDAHEIPEGPALLSAGEKDRVRGRIALIGIGRPVGADRFDVPGFSDDTERAGIYRHASALVTLREGALWIIEQKLETVISIAIIIAVFLIRVAYRRERPNLDRVLHYVAAAGVILVALVLVASTRVLWDEAIVVSLVFLASGRIEKAVNDDLPRLWRRSCKYLVEEERN